MRTYFNHDNKNFICATEDIYYVDKTELIWYLNNFVQTQRNCIAVSHARRFGKTLAARMLRAYYSCGCDSRNLFSKFLLSKKTDWDKYLNKFNVIHIDISSFYSSHENTFINDIIYNLFEDMKTQYNNINYKQSICKVLHDIYAESNTRFVIIFDEYDCVIRDTECRKDIIHKYMEFLHKVFKSEESSDYLALGYITGIFPIKKIQDESVLNNFIEYTMLDSDPITRFFGFTEHETEILCQKYSIDFKDVKKWYNGYLINENHMYNPDSVCKCIFKHKIKSYWKNTSSFESINLCIEHNFIGLQSSILSILAGEYVDVDIETFKNDISSITSKDDALTALIHLGYLAYDEQNKKAFLPNYEVAIAYRSALKNGKWKKFSELITQCEEVLKSTIDKKENDVAIYIDQAHETYTSIITYNNENSLACVIILAYFTAQDYYTIVRELPAGKGFADLAFIPQKNVINKPAMIVELKWDKTADTAIKQIKEKRYAGKLKNLSDKILLVGINYDPETKNHTCHIEEYIENS